MQLRLVHGHLPSSLERGGNQREPRKWNITKVIWIWKERIRENDRYWAGSFLGVFSLHLMVIDYFYLEISLYCSFYSQISTYFLFLKRFYLFILRERAKGGEGEKHWCVGYTLIGCLSYAPNWDPVCNPGMCPDQEWNQQPFDPQANAQFAEPHQPGLRIFF